MRVFMLAAVAAMALAGSVTAADKSAENGWLTLKTKTSKGHVIFDGTVWKCSVDVCRATKVKAVPADRACRRLAAELGEITGFGYRGQEFDAAALASCNESAKAG
jgi:hypothetical protein